MREKICFVVGASNFATEKFHPQRDDFIIAADAGYELLLEKEFSPDLIIGDFDSASKEPDGEDFIKFPSEKDDTDMLLAIKEGIKRGYKSFFLFGGLGGERISHTIANIQSLLFLTENGCKGAIIDSSCEIYCITDGEKRFDSTRTGYISVFAFGSSKARVSLSGLKYDLDNYLLNESYPLGVSNEFTGEESIITVSGGSILVVTD